MLEANFMTNVRFESLYPASSREAEIAKILSFVQAGLSCQLIGLPGTGRSNLLGLLAFNRQVRLKHLGEGQKNFHFLYLNLAEIREADLFGVNKFLFLHLVESLEERKYQAARARIQGLFKEVLSLNEPLLLWQNLKKAVDLLANQEKLSLVFLFDRFEDYQNQVTNEFFLNLRVLRSLAKYRFAVVFALSRPLEKIFDPAIYREFYESLIGHEVYLPLYDKPEMDFRLAYLGKVSGRKIDPQIKKTILTLSGGHGKLTRICLEALLAIPKPPDAGKPLEEFLSSHTLVRGVLGEIWTVLTGEEKALIQGAVRDEKIEENEALMLLSNLNLIKKTNSKVTLTIPLLLPYLQTVQTGGEKIYFRPETNEILKGHEVISDDLTAQEFRLLKFLLENPGRVCEREEVIRAVWPETKSLEGVSDEAIDQMVFRLRKKTEEDPKNPQHLQTVKGRGFRFNP